MLHFGSPLTSRAYPEGLSRDFLNIINTVPAKQARHMTNKDISKTGLEPRKKSQMARRRHRIKVKASKFYAVLRIYRSSNDYNKQE